MSVYAVIGIVFLLGSLGSLVSSFIGDNGWHLPMTDQGIFRPGFLGNMLVGGLAAVASWGMSRSINLGALHQPSDFLSSEMANALVVGFGGASWFKGQIEKVILKQTAVVAASKQADPIAARTIATATPIEALRIANQM